MRRTNYPWKLHNLTAGKLNTLPVLAKIEVAPGETLSGAIGVQTRFKALKKPLMNDLYADTWIAYIPHRIAWSGWEDFITRRSNVDIPTMAKLRFSLDPDYSNTDFRNALPMLAYNKLHDQMFARDEIFNEYNRQLRKTTSSTYTNGTANDDGGVPIGEAGATSDIGNTNFNYFGAIVPHMLGDLYSTRTTEDATSVTSDFYPTDQEGNSNNPDSLELNDPSLVDLHNNLNQSGDTNNRDRLDLDTLYRQEAIYREARDRAKYGDGYEDLLNRWGVTVPDSMLDRCEILCHKRDVTNITDIVNTAGELGQYAGHGILKTRVDMPKRLFPEHGTVLIVQTIRSSIGTSSLHHEWNSINTNIDDYFDPFLLNANLPDRQVGNHEVGASDSNTSDTANQGFIRNFDWYRRPVGAQVHDKLQSSLSGWYATPFGEGDARSVNTDPNYNDYDHIFDSSDTSFDLGDGHSAQYVTATETNLIKSSPIPKR